MILIALIITFLVSIVRVMLRFTKAWLVAVLVSFVGSVGVAVAPQMLEPFTPAPTLVSATAEKFLVENVFENPAANERVASLMRNALPEYTPDVGGAEEFMVTLTEYCNWVVSPFSYAVEESSFLGL